MEIMEKFSLGETTPEQLLKMIDATVLLEGTATWVDSTNTSQNSTSVSMILVVKEIVIFGELNRRVVISSDYQKTDLLIQKHVNGFLNVTILKPAPVSLFDKTI